MLCTHLQTVYCLSCLCQGEVPVCMGPQKTLPYLIISMSNFKALVCDPMCLDVVLSVLLGAGPMLQCL